MPLATKDDLEARIGRDLSESEEARAEALIEDASALVRSYTRREFEKVDDDEIVLRPVGTKIRLPQRPVIDVTDVVAIGGQQLPDIRLTGWVWDGADIVDIHGIGSIVLNLPEWWYDYHGTPDTYRVTYSHGYDEVPADIVAVVCAMALRTLLAPTMVDGMVGENIGQYSYQMQQGAGTAGAAVRLSNADRPVLDRYRRKATTIAVETG